MPAGSLADRIAAPYLLEVVFDHFDEDAPGWIATMYELDGCQAQGDTVEELATNIRRALEAWIDAEMEVGRSIPEPGDEPRWGWAFNDLAPVLHIVNTPDLATRCRDLLLALAAHPARPQVPEKVTA